MEGVAMTLMGIIKTEMMADTRGKIAGLIGKDKGVILTDKALEKLNTKQCKRQ